MVRCALLLRLISALFLAVPSMALAADFPSRTVEVIIPYPAGGTSDIMGRIAAAELAKRLKANVVPINRPGANGVLGTSSVATAAPDGHTLLLGSVGTHALSPNLLPSIPYDAIKSFEAVIGVAEVPNVLVVHPSLAAKSVSELIALERAAPGKLLYGTPGVATSLNMSGVLLNLREKTTFKNISFGGSGPNMANLLGNQVSIAIDNLPAAIEHIRGGSIRALAVTSSARSPMLPDVPTMQEAGVRDYAVSGWFGLFAPAGTPAAIVERINKELRSALAEPELREKLLQSGATSIAGSPQEFAAFVKSEVELWREIVAASGLKK